MGDPRVHKGGEVVVVVGVVVVVEGGGAGVGIVIVGGGPGATPVTSLLQGVIALDEASHEDLTTRMTMRADVVEDVVEEVEESRGAGQGVLLLWLGRVVVVRRRGPAPAHPSSHLRRTQRRRMTRTGEVEVGRDPGMKILIRECCFCFFNVFC